MPASAFQLNLALNQFRQRLNEVGDRWSAPTPCSEWTVRDVVNHIVNELCWIPPMLDGKTIAEVGDRFDGDLLGDDPAKAFEEAAERASAAAAAPGAMQATAHLSYGDFPGAEYLAHVTSDVVVHAWDLARAIGADEEFPEDLVKLAYTTFKPMMEMGRQFGIFADPVDVPEDASLQTKLLAMAGRRP